MKVAVMATQASRLSGTAYASGTTSGPSSSVAQGWWKNLPRADRVIPSSRK